MAKNESAGDTDPEQGLYRGRAIARAPNEIALLIQAEREVDQLPRPLHVGDDRRTARGGQAEDLFSAP